jgi:hypothetical protein
VARHPGSIVQAQSRPHPPGREIELSHSLFETRRGEQIEATIFLPHPGIDQAEGSTSLLSG